MREPCISGKQGCRLLGGDRISWSHQGCFQQQDPQVHCQCLGKCSLSVPVFSCKQVCTLSQCLAVCLCYRCLRLGGCQGVYDVFLRAGTSWPPTASPALGWELSPIVLHLSTQNITQVPSQR